MIKSLSFVKHISTSSLFLYTLIMLSTLGIAIYAFYSLHEPKAVLTGLSSISHFTIEDLRDFCTILGIILIPIGWIYNEYQQRTLDQYSSKEQKYQVMLRSADALLYEDFRHPEIQSLVYDFIKEFQVCYLYVPDNVIKAGHEFLRSFEELLQEPEEILSLELKETLHDISEDHSEKIIEEIPVNITKKQKIIYEEYLSKKQRELYKDFRDKKYPEFVKAIRKDMMSKRTKLTNEEYIVHVPSHIKISRHFEFVGKSLSHLILLLVEAKKEKDVQKFQSILSTFIKCLEPNFEEISFKILQDDKVVITIGKKKYDLITFLDKLSINRILGFEKALEVKMVLDDL